MTRRQRYRYEMFLRIREFGKDARWRSLELPAAREAFAAIAKAIDDVNEYMVDGRLAVSRTKVRARLRVSMREKLKALACAARHVSAREAPSATITRFLMPVSESDVALIATARQFMTDAARVKDRVVALGLPPTFIDDLRELTDAFDAAIRERRQAHARAAAATAGLCRAIADGFAAVRVLDIIVPNQLAREPVLLAGWRHERRLAGNGRKSKPEVGGQKPEVTHP